MTTTATATIAFLCTAGRAVWATYTFFSALLGFYDVDYRSANNQRYANNRYNFAHYLNLVLRHLLFIRKRVFRFHLFSLFNNQRRNNRYDSQHNQPPDYRHPYRAEFRRRKQRTEEVYEETYRVPNREL